VQPVLAAHGKALATGHSPSLRLKAVHKLYDPLVYRRIRAALGGRVRYVICGGSPLGRRLTAFYAGAGIQVFEGYGLTETTAAATVTAPLAPRLGTVGWPLPGSAVRIAEDGEVLLSGGQVFGGYWNTSVGAERAFQHGWFATGDIGELDADGYLTINGRKKEIIITAGGKNVAPSSVRSTTPMRRSPAPSPSAASRSSRWSSPRTRGTSPRP
jgi:long-chain acyl-CoA synthetase